MKKTVNKIMVSVIVCTYQQEQTIVQTLNSILSQKTKYSFEIIIGEDFGKDRTRLICQEYANNYSNVILTNQTENLGITANYINCIKHARGKYIMGCAGDDYWHNPQKIDIEVDFMEKHPNCVLCHTDIDTLYVKTGYIKHNSNLSEGITPPEGRIQHLILSGSPHISAVTMCFRRDIFVKKVPMDKFEEMRFPREDWPTLLILSAYGDICYIPISTATYRTSQPSITTEISYDRIRKRYEDDFIMTQYLYSLFPEWGPIDQGTIDYYKNYVHHSLLQAAYENNDFKSAREFAALDPQKGKSAIMAQNWLTFKLFRIAKLIKSTPFYIKMKRKIKIQTI